MAEFTNTKRGARCLHLSGYQYTLNKRGHNGNQYWRCVGRSCPGRATLADNDSVVSENNNHNHPPNPLQVTVSKTIEVLKERASSESTPIPTIYTDTMIALSQIPSASAAVGNVPTLPSLHSSMYRHRRKRLPPMPSTIDEVSFTGDWARTLGGHTFLVQSEDNIHVLATDQNLEILAEADEWYMDGTFKVSPRLFHQVYTIHAFKYGQQFPLVYCLLPGKSEEVYAKLFSIIAEAMGNLQLQPQLARATADFEIAMIKALKGHFPTVSVKGCFYHFAQAVWRKVQGLGLQEEYKTNPDLTKTVSKMLSLSLCPVRYVRIAWQAILADAPQVQNIDALCDYFSNTWLNGNFPLPSWNHYSTNGPRTNNHVEGWHNKLNSAAGKAHPNVFELVELFRNEQAMTEVTLQQLAAGGATRKRERCYRIKDRAIKRVQQKFEAGTYSIDEYIDQISKWMGFL